jgi:hypothetical protein
LSDVAGGMREAPTRPPIADGKGRRRQSDDPAANRRPDRHGIR